MKTWIKALSLAATLIGAPALATAQTAATDPAAQQVETFHAALIDAMKKGKELGVQGRYKALEPVVEQTFNLPYMAQYTVGPDWTKFSDADKAAVIAAYKRMTVAEYAGNFDSYSNQKFTTDPTVQVRGNDHVVLTTLSSPGDKPVTFIYRMRQTNGAWKAIDVLLDGTASQLATKRSDFASTVASGGAPALIKTLNDLADKRLK